MQNVLSHEFTASLQALFYPNCAANPDLGAAVIDFMAILQSIDYNQFQGFSNVADEISTRLFSSFCEYEVLVAVPYRYNFEFSIKANGRKRQTEASTHIQEIEIINN